DVALGIRDLKVKLCDGEVGRADAVLGVGDVGIHLLALGLKLVDGVLERIALRADLLQFCLECGDLFFDLGETVVPLGDLRAKLVNLGLRFSGTERGAAESRDGTDTQNSNERN